MAHTVRLNGGNLKKGVMLRGLEIEQLRENLLHTVMAACSESGDVLENDAAARIARVISGANITAEEALAGRVNLFAKKDGALDAKAERIMDLNRVHEAMTVATPNLLPKVPAGHRVATMEFPSIRAI